MLRICSFLTVLLLAATVPAAAEEDAPKTERFACPLVHSGPGVAQHPDAGEARTVGVARREPALGGELFCYDGVAADGDTVKRTLRERGTIEQTPYVAQFASASGVSEETIVQFGTVDPANGFRAVDMFCGLDIFGIFGGCDYSLGGGGFAMVQWRTFGSAPRLLVTQRDAVDAGLDLSRSPAVRFDGAGWIEADWTRNDNGDASAAFAPESLTDAFATDPAYLEVRYHLQGADRPVVRRFALRFLPAAQAIATKWLYTKRSAAAADTP